MIMMMMMMRRRRRRRRRMLLLSSFWFCLSYVNDTIIYLKSLSKQIEQ